MSLMPKRDEVQNWANEAKQSSDPAAGTILNKAANTVKQRESGKKKPNKQWDSRVYKAPSRKTKRNDSNRETDYDFEVDDVPKKSIKYNC